jgi:hypothetical protein
MVSTSFARRFEHVCFQHVYSKDAATFQQVRTEMHLGPYQTNECDGSAASAGLAGCSDHVVVANKKIPDTVEARRRGRQHRLPTGTLAQLADQAVASTTLPTPGAIADFTAPPLSSESPS